MNQADARDIIDHPFDHDHHEYMAAARVLAGLPPAPSVPVTSGLPGYSLRSRAGLAIESARLTLAGGAESRGRGVLTAIAVLVGAGAIAWVVATNPTRQDVSALSAQVTELEGELRVRDSREEALLAEQRSLSVEVGLLEDRHAEMVEDLSSTAGERDELRADHASLQETMTAERATAADDRQELAVTKAELASARTSLASMAEYELTVADYLEDAVAQQRHFDAVLFLAEISFRLESSPRDLETLAAAYKDAFDQVIENYKARDDDGPGAAPPP